MNAPALALPPTPFLDPEAVFARLPAEVRAQLQWARRPIEIAIDRLRTEPLTDALVDSVAADLSRPLHAVTGALGHAVLATVDDTRAASMQELHDVEAQLRDFVADEDSKDSVAWIFGVLRSFYQYVPQALATAAASMSDAALTAATNAPELRPFLRAVVALIAALKEAREHGDPQRAADLVDVAFLEANAFRRIAQRSGLMLVPFPFETLEERRQRLLRSSDRLRESLNDADWATLEGARLRDLR